MDQIVSQRTQQVIDAGALRTVEIIVHIREELDAGRRSELIAALTGSPCITSAEFCPLRFHLLLVNYDRDASSSQDVLKKVTTRGLNARLIGPV